MKKVYIIVGNDGLPRYADPECSKLFVANSREAALDTAQDMVKACPLVVFGVYALDTSVFFDGCNVNVVTSDGREDKN